MTVTTATGQPINPHSIARQLIRELNGDLESRALLTEIFTSEEMRRDRERLYALESAVPQLIDLLKEILDSLPTAMVKALEPLGSAVDNLQTDLTNVGRIQQAILPQLESLQASQQAVLPQLESLQASQQAVLPQLESLQASQQAVLPQLESLQASQQAALPQLESLQASQQAALPQLESLQASQQATLPQLESLQASQQAVLPQLESLLIFQQTIQAEIDAIRDTLRTVQATIGNLDNSVAEIKGWGLELLSSRRISRYADTLNMTGLREILQSQIRSIAEDAARKKDITTDEMRQVSNADAYFYGHSSILQNDAYLVVQISYTVNSNDVSRAIDQSVILNKITGNAAIPVVAGTYLRPDAAAAINGPVRVYYVPMGNGNSLRA